MRYAKLIACGRVEVENHKVWDGSQTAVEFEAGKPEGPHRIILLLQALGQGLALADGRLVVTSEDVAIIRHIAFSSIPRKRRELLRALLTAGGSVNTSQTMEAINVSKPTTLSRMKELGATGLADFTPSESKSSSPSKITLADGWKWLLDSTPVKSTRGVQAA